MNGYDFWLQFTKLLLARFLGLLQGLGAQLETEPDILAVYRSTLFAFDGWVIAEHHENTLLRAQRACNPSLDQHVTAYHCAGDSQWNRNCEANCLQDRSDLAIQDETDSGEEQAEQSQLA